MFSARLGADFAYSQAAVSIFVFLLQILKAVNILPGSTANVTPHVFQQQLFKQYTTHWTIEERSAFTTLNYNSSSTLNRDESTYSYRTLQLLVLLRYRARSSFLTGAVDLLTASLPQSDPPKYIETTAHKTHVIRRS